MIFKTEKGCPKCGSNDITKISNVTANYSVSNTFRCNWCGKIFTKMS